MSMSTMAEPASGHCCVADWLDAASIGMAVCRWKPRGNEKWPDFCQAIFGLNAQY
jgi:hypothetical protein